MANVFDYLDWRGDLTLDLVPLCDVDAVVLSRLSYLPLDGLVPPGGGAGRRAHAAAPRFEAPLLLPEDGGSSLPLRQASASARCGSWIM